MAARSTQLILAKFVLVLVLCKFLASGQRTSTQTEYAVCRYTVQNSQVRMEFRLDLNSDPTGYLVALDYSSEVGVTGCQAVLSGSLWTITSVLDTASTPPSGVGNGGCGFSSQIVGTETHYMWKILYGEYPNRKDVDAGLNREYHITCSPSNTANNQLVTSVSVSTPNLNQDATVTNVQPTLHLYREQTAGSGNYVLVTANDQLPVGTRARLELRLPFGSFSANRYYGVAGLQTDVDSESSFTTSGLVPFFDNNGCPVTSNNVRPSQFTHTGTTGTDAANNRVFIQQTGVFNLFSIQGNPMLHFRVFYGLCHGSTGINTPLCEDPCTANTNAGRRRRSEETEGTEVTLSVRVVPANDVTKEDSQKPNSGLVYGLAGACVVFAIVLVVMVIACSCILRSKRSGKQRNLPRETRVVA